MGTIMSRKGKTGTRYTAQIRLKGHPPLAATFPRKTDAQRWIAKIESDILSGKFMPTSEARKHTLADAVARYLIEEMPHKGKTTQHQHTLILNMYAEKLGHLRLCDVTPPRILEARAELLGSGLTPGSVRTYEIILQTVLKAAMRWQWAQANPFEKLDRLAAPKNRVRFLSQDELADFRAACRESGNADLWHFAELALATGCRKSEILELTWDRVDWQRAQFRLEKTKNGEPRNVSLTAHALDILQERHRTRRMDTALVFPRRTKPKEPVKINAVFRAACLAAKLKDVSPHTLRHTFASYLAMGGASVPEIAAALGHRDFNMASRYAHLCQNHTRRVVQGMADKFLQEGGA